jgi:hypothetical protein
MVDSISREQLTKLADATDAARITLKQVSLQETAPESWMLLPVVHLACSARSGECCRWCACTNCVPRLLSKHACMTLYTTSKRVLLRTRTHVPVQSACRRSRLIRSSCRLVS